MKAELSVTPEQARSAIETALASDPDLWNQGPITVYVQQTPYADLSVSLFGEDSDGRMLREGAALSAIYRRIARLAGVTIRNPFRLRGNRYEDWNFMEPFEMAKPPLHKTVVARMRVAAAPPMPKRAVRVAL